jgi:hypothetical protein
MSQVNSRKKTQILDKDILEFTKVSEYIKRFINETNDIVNQHFNGINLINTLESMSSLGDQLHNYSKNINYESCTTIINFLEVLHDSLDAIKKELIGIEILNIELQPYLTEIHENINKINNIKSKYIKKYSSINSKLTSALISPTEIKDFISQYIEPDRELAIYHDGIEDFYKKYKQSMVLLYEKCYTEMLKYLTHKEKVLQSFQHYAILQKLNIYSTYKNNLIKNNINKKALINNAQKYNIDNLSATNEVGEAIDALHHLKQIYKNTLRTNINTVKRTESNMKNSITRIIEELKQLILQYKTLINSNSSLRPEQLLENGTLNQLTQNIIQKLTELNNSSTGASGSGAAGGV